MYAGVLDMKTTTMHIDTNEDDHTHVHKTGVRVFT